jgi:hypothetical protein
LIFAERLKRIPCLFAVRFCPRGIPGKALDYSQGYLINAPFDLRSKVELSLSGLQQANGLTEIPFKSQLSELGYEGGHIWSLPVYFR